MRLFFAVLLSLVFSLNGAFAAVVEVCDAVDHLPQRGTGQHLHVDHHNHDAVESTAATSPDDGDPLKASASADHCHAHGASASVVPGSDTAGAPLCGAPVLAAHPDATLVSITPARLERPPRVSRA
jgi:hypothetical protein